MTAQEIPKVRSLDESALRAACAEIARTITWELKPIDVSAIEAVEDELFEIALMRKKLIEDHRDPNIVVRAVEHLCDSHALPPMQGDTVWFSNMLEALLELAAPSEINRSLIRFFNDVSMGIIEAREQWDESHVDGHSDESRRSR